MGALQTSLYNVPITVGAMKLYLGVGKDEQREAVSSAPKLRNCCRSIGPRSLSGEWALVQRALAGDSDSQDRLFAAHTAKLYRTAFAVLRNKEDAEDAVQDGLCSAYTKLRSFQGRSSFSTWLTRIVINTALMNRRRKGAHPEASLDEILDSQEGWVTHRIVDLRPDPEKICSVIEIDGLVKKEIQRLPLAVQRAFQLREVNGLSTAESIRTLGIRKSAFKSRILRARQKLTEALQRSLQPHVHAGPASTTVRKQLNKALSEIH
jgi:RNA polymerase sigma-70 factor (ECF subfamily)